MYMFKKSTFHKKLCFLLRLHKIADIGVWLILNRWLKVMLNSYQKINVWTKIINNRIVGFNYFKENLYGECSLQFSRTKVIPVLVHLIPNANHPDVISWLQQDSALSSMQKVNCNCVCMNAILHIHTGVGHIAPKQCLEALFWTISSFFWLYGLTDWYKIELQSRTDLMEVL